LVVSFTGKLLDILHHCLPSTITELDHALSDGVSRGGRQALEWRASIAKHFIEEWEWQLSILQRLLSLSERQWQWKEALTVLRPAPSRLLNLSLQCSSSKKYSIMSCYLRLHFWHTKCNCQPPSLQRNARYKLQRFSLIKNCNYICM
ncbi:unnamed protein product, partial [Prunus brigantina]